MYVIGSVSRPQSPPVVDSTISTRKDTVTALWERIQQVGVVHVRGTPATGKSTLARLLEDHVRTIEPNLEVYRFAWPLSFPGEEWNPFENLLNAFTKLSLRQIEWQTYRRLLIIDEAQESYKCISLWNDLIKGLSPRSGPLIVLFSSYGSPSAKPLGRISTPTPIKFSLAQRVSLRRSDQNANLALLFSPTEFSDVVVRVCKSYSQHGQALLLSPELIDYIWELTNGHPAGVRAVLDELALSKASINCFPVFISLQLTKSQSSH
jgi:hypothetical protein